MPDETDRRVQFGGSPSLSDDTIINGHLCSHNNSIQRSVHRLNSKQPLYCSARSFQTIYVLHQSKDTQVSPAFVAPRSGQPTSCSNGGSKVIGCTYEGKMPAPSAKPIIAARSLASNGPGAQRYSTHCVPHCATQCHTVSHCATQCATPLCATQAISLC